MTPRIVRLGLAAVLAFAALAARAQAPVPAAPAASTTPAATASANPDDELVSLKLPDADIDTVLTSLEALTGRTVLRPAALATATYNFKTPKPMPKSEVVLALETVLMLNGISVSPQGEKFLVVTQLQNARSSSPEMITGSAFDQPASGKIATKLFQLEFLRVNDVLPLLQGMLNPGLLGSVALPTANSVLVTDTVSNLQRLEVLLRNLDKPTTAGMTPKFYQLHSAKAADVVTRLRSIFQPLQQQLGSTTTYNSDDRTNQIILISDPRQYSLFDNVIAKLDDAAAEPDIHNEVIYLKNAVATEMVTVITQLVSGQIAAAQRANAQTVRLGVGANSQPLPANVAPIGPGGPLAPAPISPVNPAITAALDGANVPNSNAFSSLASAFADKRSNSIIVTGTSQDIRLIRDVIDKLDIILPQVRIEVVIAEVTLDDSATSGISALGLKVDGDKLVGFNGTGAGFGVNGVAGVTDFATITRTAGNVDLAGLISLNTTPRKSNSTILTVPSVVTSHGNQAKFFDGETRPVVTGSTNTPISGSVTTSSQVTQQEIGTTLTVTPFIGNDGSVQLNLDQNVSDVTGTVTVDGNNQYIIGTRKTTQYVTAHSGEIIVLGGFRKKTDSKGTSRLGPIPFLGDLFGTRTRQNRHQELVFFLRPTILTNSPRDNVETMKHVDALPTRDEIRKEVDPNYVSPKKTLLDKLLQK